MKKFLLLFLFLNLVCSCAIVFDPNNYCIPIKETCLELKTFSDKEIEYLSNYEKLPYIDKSPIIIYGAIGAHTICTDNRCTTFGVYFNKVGKNNDAFEFIKLWIINKNTKKGLEKEIKDLIIEDLSKDPNAGLLSKNAYRLEKVPKEILINRKDYILVILIRDKSNKEFLIGKESISWGTDDDYDKLPDWHKELIIDKFKH
ncbi:MAG: hypothetical protein U0457_16735 [Candidatus Sericytochromatia bacterium]